ncbi:DUF3298 domain-containing protein [Gramella sp. MT6]|uniref:RsiV family protein n=1 Tax=Gramella sp. MT6 TaxID=2705471 RepID=UPI001C60593B|nr:RsiV family protein [Gramella sp. MT6]QYA26972.1 DUF3298 domain-containing protein [Gramella sp. MT6]
MQKVFFIWVILIFSSCAENPKEAQEPLLIKDSIQRIDTISTGEIDFDFREYRYLKNSKDSLLQREDDRQVLEDLVIPKSYLKIEKFYMLSFKYPLLNEKINSQYTNFNSYLLNSFLNVKEIEAELENCDTSAFGKYPEIRRIDYKIYNANEKFMSVLFYKENFYSKTPLPVYRFETLNYDLKNSEFMNYNDLFLPNSEEILREILNEILVQKINSGEIYYDCWEISEEDFEDYKNNFVLIDSSIEYYFDDCIICPSYTGIFSIKIPLEKLNFILNELAVNRISSDLEYQE